MAVTIDDLPFVNPGGTNFLTNAQRATTKILRSLRAHQPPAIGFVIESRLHATGEVDQRIALLQQWVDAGMTLGNHTYSHRSFNDLTVDQFQDGIIEGGVITRRLMEPHKPYQLYFRHPMTHTGDTQQKREAIMKFLTARGYRITPHTIENSDFIFNMPYAQALQNGDTALARRLLGSYLDYNLAVTKFAERISVEIFGREVAQTLAIHANDINADSLATMLSGWEERGEESQLSRRSRATAMGGGSVLGHPSTEALVDVPVSPSVAFPPKLRHHGCSSRCNPLILGAIRSKGCVNLPQS